MGKFLSSLTTVSFSEGILLHDVNSILNLLVSRRNWQWPNLRQNPVVYLEIRRRTMKALGKMANIWTKTWTWDLLITAGHWKPLDRDVWFVYCRKHFLTNVSWLKFVISCNPRLSDLETNSRRFSFRENLYQYFKSLCHSNSGLCLQCHSPDYTMWHASLFLKSVSYVIIISGTWVYFRISRISLFVFCDIWLIEYYYLNSRKKIK